MKRIRSAPYSVRIELTLACNLSCAHCLANASAPPLPNELSTAEWLRLFDHFKELQVFRVTVSGGEPFIRRDALELLRALMDRRFTVTVLTNGTLITDRVAAELSAMRIPHVWIALDGLRDTHDAVRGRGSFDRTLRGIHHLIGHGIVPGVNFVPMRHNVQDLAGLIDLLAAAGIRRIGVNTLRPEGRCEVTYAGLAPRFPDDLRIVRETLDAKRCEHEHVRISSSATFYFDVERAQAARNRQRLPDTNDALKSESVRQPTRLMAGCSACLGSCHVTATGDVLPCLGLGAFAGGNVRTTSLREIWHGSSAFQTIAGLYDRVVTDIPECADCVYTHVCHGGCRADAFNALGNLLAPDPLCPFWSRHCEYRPAVPAMEDSCHEARTVGPARGAD